MSDVHTPKEPVGETSSNGSPKAEGSANSASEGLRRRFGVHSNNEDRSRDSIDSGQSSAAVKLDDAAWTHIEKHRYLIQLRKQLSIAWQVQDTRLPEQWMCIHGVSRQRASSGF